MNTTTVPYNKVPKTFTDGKKLIVFIHRGSNNDNTAGATVAIIDKNFKKARTLSTQEGILSSIHVNSNGENIEWNVTLLNTLFKQIQTNV